MRLALAALLLASLPALAAAPWDAEPFTAEPAALLRAAHALSPPQGSEVDILLEEGSYAYDAEGRETSTYRVLYRVLTPEGARGWATIGTPWSPWFEERPVLEARVITPDGKAHTLDPATLVELIPEDKNPESFSDRRVVRAPLPAITVGAIVEQRIVSRESTTPFASGTTRRFYFGKQVPVRKARLVLEAPSTTSLRFLARGLQVKPRRSEQQGRTRLVFEQGPLAALPAPESLLPPDVPQWPHVAFSTGASWTALARRYHEAVEAQLKDVDLTSQAREAVGTETRREAVALRLLTWVHEQVRYTGLQLGEASVVPRSPYETLLRKYGDCKDMATLLVALLRASGIPAQVALVRVGPEEVQEALPGFGLFDHAIVYLPGQPALWVDATDAFNPPGSLTGAVQGRLALVAAPDPQGLIRLPEAPATASGSTATREYFLAEQGPSRLVERKAFTGAQAALYREHFTRSDPDKVREGYGEYAKTAFSAPDVGRLEPRELTALDKPFVVELELPAASRGYTDEREAVVGLWPLSLFSHLPEALTAERQQGTPARRSELLLPDAYTSELRYRVVPPPGFSPAPLPAPFSLKLGPTTYSGAFSQQGAEVLVTFRLETGKRRYSAAEVEAFREGIARLDAKSEPLVLRFRRDGAEHLAAGRIAEALREFRRLVALHPEEALHRAHLALALLEAGAGDEARAEARRAVDAEPKSATAWRALAMALEHDALGRRFKPGFDHAGALAAWRQAKALDSEDAFTRGGLAILLEHDARGERYAPGARLDEALAEYKALREELGRKEMDENRLVALFQAERYREVLALAPEVEASPLRDALRVASVTMDEGVDAAVRKASTWMSSAEARRGALATASSRLQGLRRYPEAHALLVEAARGAPNSAELQGRVGLLAKLTRFDEKAVKEEDPRSAVQRMMVAVLSPSLSEADAKALFAKSVAGAAPGAARDVVEEARRVMRQSLRRSDLPPRTLMDMTLGLMELRAEGDPKVGFRVQSNMPLSGRGSSERWFVVREGGRYRLLALERDVPELAHEALRRAEAGELEAARQWLSWARDALPSSLPEHRVGANFLRLWGQGAAQAGKEQVVLAAASLMAYGDGAKKALPLLEAARRKADTEELRRAWDRDLAAAYDETGRMKELLEVADRLLAAAPEDEQAWWYSLRALRKLGRADERVKRAEARLARLPGDGAALEELATVAVERGDVAAARRSWQQVVDTGKATAHTYNQLAWSALFLGPATQEALEQAQRANQLTEYQESSYVHTLATLYAEQGKGPEARQLLLKSLELKGTDELQTHDWYVVGRIAEGYGLVDLARSAYAKARVTKPEPLDTDTLAKARQELITSATTAGTTP
jgi:tetratricopeptide (TPR) repeat protein/transglutaminase-like putative cysteine protease